MIRRWVPPKLLERLKPLLRRGIYFAGRYPNWQAARADSTGYQSELILERVAQATLRVKAGEAAYERDSVLFTNEKYPYPVLAVLLRASVENGNRLSVLDVGGSLGSTYFQCRKFLSVLSSLRWCVVEQEHFVQRGREHFADEKLQFVFTVADGLQQGAPDVVLLSSVLQYLPDPAATVAELTNAGPRYLVIDRTPFAQIDDSCLTVQHVPRSLYPASYPCWIFSRGQCLTWTRDGYDLLGEFDSDDGYANADGMEIRFGGMILRRR